MFHSAKDPGDKEARVPGKQVSFLFGWIKPSWNTLVPSILISGVILRNRRKTNVLSALRNVPDAETTV